MECNHKFETRTCTLVRTHLHTAPKRHASGVLYDEYACEVCHNYRIAAFRKPDGVHYEYDEQGARKIEVLTQ